MKKLIEIFFLFMLFGLANTNTISAWDGTQDAGFTTMRRLSQIAELYAPLPKNVVTGIDFSSMVDYGPNFEDAAKYPRTKEDTKVFLSRRKNLSIGVFLAHKREMSVRFIITFPYYKGDFNKIKNGVVGTILALEKEKVGNINFFDWIKEQVNLLPPKYLSGCSFQFHLDHQEGFKGEKGFFNADLRGHEFSVTADYIDGKSESVRIVETAKRWFKEALKKQNP